MTATPWFKLLKSQALLAFLIALPLSLPSFAQSPPLFPVTTFNDAGTQQVMATGDFDGNGQPDLATISPNSSSSTLTILLNQGNTTPPLSKTTALNINVVQLTAVDINKDTKLDLVATCTSGTSTGIAVLLGNGDGTFQPPVFYPISNIGNIVTVDLNGDGYPDIAAISSSSSNQSNTLYVMLNQGLTSPGTLSAPNAYSFAIGSSPLAALSIGSGDFNGDGKQDVLILGDVPVLFYGHGDGTLQQSSQQVAAISAAECCLVTADFNHDGITDIAYLGAENDNPTPLALAVLLGNTTGTFTPGSIVPIGLATNQPLALVPVGTSNGNNIALAAVGDKTTILLSDSNGNFTQGPTYAVNGTPFPIPNSSGKTDLLLDLKGSAAGSVHNQLTHLNGNGNGTFQGAAPNFPTGSNGFFAADFNNDGLTDVLTINGYYNILNLGIGRGDGTFLTSSLLHNFPGQLLIAADFNADGNQDFAIMTPGNASQYPQITQDSLLYLYLGNGDGTFQSTSQSSNTPTPFDLKIVGAADAVTGDFNGDGIPDLIVSYSDTYNDPSPTQGLAFVPGKGNGTFGTPVHIASQPLSVPPAAAPLVLAADLNGDHKLDLLWNGNVYLGNGDGTFKSEPSLPGPVLAVGDLNGDSIPDAVIGNAIYAGNGDGTFQSSPFYTAPVPASATITLANISDSNADGHPDLLLQYQLNAAVANNYLAVYLGDGKGNFTADTNTYYLGGTSAGTSSIAALARLNNQAPPLSKGLALDYLTWTNGGATSLLNQTNPSPAAPSPLTSKTTITVYPGNAAYPTQPVTFTAQVAGISPTGSVTFTSGGRTLGTSLITSLGAATLSAPFPAPGTYTVTATYSGDTNNLTSSGAAAVTVAQATPTLNLGASNLTAGATQEIELLVSLGGYAPTGTVTFSIVGGATLGTPIIINDSSTLNTSFDTPGTYTVTASYAGDAANLPATSNSITITVMPQDFTLSSSGTVGSIVAGQSIGAILTITPGAYGYTRPIAFSCATLEAGEACTFTPSTVTLPSIGQATTQLIISTTAASTTSSLRRIVDPLQDVAWAGLLCLLVFPRNARRKHHQLRRTSILTVLLAITLIHLSGCSSGGSNNQNQGTPVGNQTITVTASDASGTPSHSITIQLTVR